MGERFFFYFIKLTPLLLSGRGFGASAYILVYEKLIKSSLELHIRNNDELAFLQSTLQIENPKLEQFQSENDKY